MSFTVHETTAAIIREIQQSITGRQDQARLVAPEALLAEVAWLKRLALTLGGDSDHADDLVRARHVLDVDVALAAFHPLE